MLSRYIEKPDTFLSTYNEKSHFYSAYIVKVLDILLHIK